MGVESIVVNGTELNLPASNRKLYGQPVNRRSGGVHVIQALFKVWGTDNNDLNSKWNAIKTAFNIDNVTCTVKYDSAAGTTMESIVIGAGAGTRRHYQSVAVSVEQVEEQATNESLMGLLTIVADYVDIEPGSVPALLGSIVVATTINEAGFKQRELTATFVNTGTSALANYNAAKATLLGSSYLDVGAGGVVGGSDNMALVSETVSAGTSPQTVNVSLTASEDIQVFTAVGARRVTDLMIRRMDTPEWFTDGAGLPPVAINANGMIVVDKNTFSGDLMDIFSQVEGTVKSQAQTQTKATELEFVSVRLGVDYARSAITFDATYLGDNTTVFEYSLTEQQSETPRFFESGPDADGYNKVQRRPGINDIFITATLTRKGIGKDAVFATMPDYDGMKFPGLKGAAAGLSGEDYDWLMVDEPIYSCTGPTRNKWSEDVWTQQWTQVFKAHKFKAGQEVSTLKVGR